MTVMEQKKREKRGKVLLAARRCFVRHGFHATGMAEIGKACRMSVGNLYRYFPNQAAIVRAIADETLSRVAPVFARLEKHADPVEGIVQLVLFSVREFCRDSEARLWLEVSAEAPRSRLVKKMCLAFDRELRELLKRLLQNAIRAGQAPPDLDLDAAALWLVALLDGAIARVSLQPELNLAGALDALAGGIRRGFCANAG
jgi:TetR/AcrR family transcriptional regulator, repressor for uid operon